MWRFASECCRSSTTKTDDGSIALCRGCVDLARHSGCYEPRVDRWRRTHLLRSGVPLTLLEDALQDADGRCDGAKTLWPAALLAARLLECTRVARGRCVVELGAGCGLPSLVCARTGATRVVATEHPTALRFLRENARLRSVRLPNSPSFLSFQEANVCTRWSLSLERACACALGVTVGRGERVRVSQCRDARARLGRRPRGRRARRRARRLRAPARARHRLHLQQRAARAPPRDSGRAARHRNRRRARGFRRSLDAERGAKI